MRGILFITQKINFRLILFGLAISRIIPLYAQDDGAYRLQNPVTMEWLTRNLQKKSPRLILDRETEILLRKRLKTDPVIQNVYQVIRFRAEQLLEKEIITLDVPENPRSQKNQLGISRDFLARMNMLAMVYRIERDPKILERIDREITAACNFPSWNPKHFLDVGEMSLAVSLALDWTAGDLSQKTIALAKKSLIEKGIKASWPEDGSTPGWVYGTNNWNQVCNAGMIAASLIVADQEPELAAKTIWRSIEGMNNALREYGPDGAYPEGPIYWGYGTMFSAVTASICESALGTDFGISKFPGFMESAVYAVMTLSPTGKLYSYADCNETPEDYNEFSLAWFASKTGNKGLLNMEYFTTPPEEITSFSRLAGAGLIWLTKFKENQSQGVPSAWRGRGANPVVIFTGGENDPHGYYFGGKGGRGTVNHGNMDGGSFIFELNGVRWSIDPGNQSYGLLERAGFNLWGRCQDCDRWKLLSKNNFGHSTLTVNNSLHEADGLAEMVSFSGGPNPEAVFDLTPAFGSQLKSVTRKFVKDSPVSLVVEDVFEISPETRTITWQMITEAVTEYTKDGIILYQDGKKLKLENLSHPEFSFSVISLDPPPLELDLQWPGLKRIELQIPAWTIREKQDTIQIRLVGL